MSQGVNVDGSAAFITLGDASGEQVSVEDSHPSGGNREQRSLPMASISPARSINQRPFASEPFQFLGELGIRGEPFPLDSGLHGVERQLGLCPVRSLWRVAVRFGFILIRASRLPSVFGERPHPRHLQQLHQLGRERPDFVKNAS